MKKEKTGKKTDLGIREQLMQAFKRVIGFITFAAIVAIIALVFMSSRYEHALQ